MNKTLFIEACFCKDLQSFYSGLLLNKPGWKQYFDVLPCGLLIHKFWQPSRICCESGEELTAENIDVKVGYWTPFVWKPIRKDLKHDAMKIEALECQKIDCSCNDCKHLDRAKSWCNKLEKKTDIIENMCHPQNQQCFEHRKSQTIKKI